MKEVNRVNLNQKLKAKECSIEDGVYHSYLGFKITTKDLIEYLKKGMDDIEILESINK